jgi:hypothetical protein
VEAGQPGFVSHVGSCGLKPSVDATIIFAMAIKFAGLRPATAHLVSCAFLSRRIANQMDHVNPMTCRQQGYRGRIPAAAPAAGLDWHR